MFQTSKQRVANPTTSEQSPPPPAPSAAPNSILPPVPGRQPSLNQIHSWPDSELGVHEDSGISPTTTLADSPIDLVSNTHAPSQSSHPNSPRGTKKLPRVNNRFETSINISPRPPPTFTVERFTPPSSKGTSVDWCCRRGHVIHDIYIAYKSVNDSLAFEIAARLEIASPKRNITVHLDKLCLNIGSGLIEDAIRESLPRCKIFVLLICPDMLSGFKTADKTLSFPLQELEKAVEMDGRPMILPIFIDGTLKMIHNEFESFPNTPHANPMSERHIPIREIVGRLKNLKGYYFTRGEKADVEGLVAKIAQQVVSLEQRDLRWRWLVEPSNSPGGQYDAFISYRVSSEKKLARALYYVLSAERQRINGFERGLKIYLDQLRLINGEKWESGFINGLRSSDIVILLISRSSFQLLKKANTCPDSVLLEIEVAFDLLDHRRDKQIVIQPVFLNGYLPDEKEISEFPEEPHAHPASPKMATVRGIVKRLKSLQGIKVDIPEDGTGLIESMEVVAPHIVKRLQGKWERNKTLADRILFRGGGGKQSGSSGPNGGSTGASGESDGAELPCTE